MANYFTHFNKLLYNDTLVTDILSRFSIRDKLQSNDQLYFKYILKIGDTPDNIAAKYYDNPELHWVVMISNNMLDNRFDVVMEYPEFIKYLDYKYAVQAANTNLLSGRDYAAATDNPDPYSHKLTITTTQTTSAYYNGQLYTDTTKPSTEIYYIDSASAANTSTGINSKGSFTQITTLEPLSIYDWEDIKNENKRTIKLLKKQYVTQLEQELKRIFK